VQDDRFVTGIKMMPVPIPVGGVAMDLNVTGNTLSIEGRRTAEHRKDDPGTYLSRERHTGSFKKTFSLSKTIDADKIHAAYDNGVLTITLVKKPEPKPISVAIK